MTDTATATEPRRRQVRRGGLYVLDVELYEILGVPEKIMRRRLPELEAKFGFPRKQKLFGDRRYLPAVEAWLNKHNGILPQDTNRRA